MAFVEIRERQASEAEQQLTWKRFLELPGRLSSLFSPTLRDPSLILDELDVNGSGAASFDSFYGYEMIVQDKKKG